MTPTLEPILLHVTTFLMVLFRLAGLFIFAPMFGSRLVPPQVKALLALVLAFCVYPMVPAQAPLPLSLSTLAVSVGGEMLIGLAIGYGASLPLIAMQMAGLLMGQQLGLGLAQVFNPDTESETSVLGQGLFMMALIIFLAIGGDHAMIGAVVDSFAHVPLGGHAPDGGGIVSVIVGLLAAMTELAVRVAAPLLCLVFLETVAMGFIAKTVPQLNILSMGFPLRIILGLWLIAAVMIVTADPLSAAMGEAVGSMAGLFVGE